MPESALEAVPYRIGNLPPDEVVFAAYSSVAIDAESRIVTVDTRDCVPPLLANEWILRYIVPAEQIARAGRLPAAPDAGMRPPLPPSLRSPVSPDDSNE